MKKVINIVIILLVSFLEMQSNAQTFVVKGGLNLANMLMKDDVDIYSNEYKMNPGFHVGATVEVGFSDVFSFETGLLFDKKGFRIKEEGQQ